MHFKLSKNDDWIQVDSLAGNTIKITKCIKGRENYVTKTFKRTKTRDGHTRLKLFIEGLVKRNLEEGYTYDYGERLADSVYRTDIDWGMENPLPKTIKYQTPILSETTPNSNGWVKNDLPVGTSLFLLKDKDNGVHLYDADFNDLTKTVYGVLRKDLMSIVHTIPSHSWLLLTLLTVHPEKIIDLSAGLVSKCNKALLQTQYTGCQNNGLSVKFIVNDIYHYGKHNLIQRAYKVRKAVVNKLFPDNEVPGQYVRGELFIKENAVAPFTVGPNPFKEKGKYCYVLHYQEESFPLIQVLYSKQGIYNGLPTMFRIEMRPGTRFYIEDINLSVEDYRKYADKMGLDYGDHMAGALINVNARLFIKYTHKSPYGLHNIKIEGVSREQHQGAISKITI